MIGQDRAVDAIRLGIGVRSPGYNIFAFGPPGHGKLSAIRPFLMQEARRRPVPDGWCYVYGFADRSRPTALGLPPGRASVLRDRMHQLVEGLLQELPLLFEGGSFTKMVAQITATYSTKIGHDVMGPVAKAANAKGIGLFHDDGEWRLAPCSEKSPDEPMTPDEFAALPASRRGQLGHDMDLLQPMLDQALGTVRSLSREARRSVAEARKEFAKKTVGAHMGEVRQLFVDQQGVGAYLAAVEADVLDHLDLFLEGRDGTQGGEEDDGLARDTSAVARRRADVRLRRYDVNVLVDHEASAGAPVVTESHPTLANLVGYVDSEERSGVRYSDFTLVQAGALHRANGGYLVLEAEELLKESHSWDALKRALRGDRIRIEPPGDGGTPGSVDPEPIPLDVKVVLVGEPYFYYQLHETDGEFAELFKVGAEFGETMRRDQATELAYARFAATIVQREGLLPLGREAVAAVIEHSSRLAEDAGLLSADFLSVTDLLREADYWARSLGRPAIDAVDVDHAIKARERMADRVREELHDSVRRGILQIDTQGSRSGVVNGLVIVGQGDFEFALPSRISASVRMGGGEVLDIEREVDLSGPLHSKGVLVLAGFLGGRYVPDTPLAMSASLTFEQSHQPVDGDSASVAELVAILSALAEVPVRQDIAVTGSISQDGTVQAVGGVDTKIEGFHDVCALGGLTGSQGVAVPRANVQQLMLRQDVIDAAAQGRFHVYAVDHLDELVPLLTGLEPGARGTDGTYPEGTFNRKVEDRLAELAEKRREKGHGPDEEEDLDPDEGASGRRRPRRKTEDRRRPRGQ